jgi:hypothetical protein
MHSPTCTLAPKPASLEELIQKAKTFVAASKAPQHSRLTEMTGETSSPGAASIS